MKNEELDKTVNKIKDIGREVSKTHSEIMFILGRIDAKLDSITHNLDRMKEDVKPQENS